MTERYNVDLVVVGSGPAGLSAAKTAAEFGLKVIVIDEFLKPGGRMLGQFHEEPDGKWWVGQTVAQEVIADCQKLGVDIVCETPVHGLQPDGDGWVVFTPHGRFHSRFLLLATGAAEVPTPVPGWTLPGVMSIGAAQVMANVHRVKPGRKGIVVGVNVLGMAIARELSVSGVNISGIVLPPANPFSVDAARPNNAMNLLAGLSHLAPSPVFRIGGRFAKNPSVARAAVRFFPKQGLRVWGIPLHLRSAIVSIHGTERVESVTLVQIDGNGQPIAGTERQEPVDFVAIAGGLYPLAELASIAGCSFVHVPELGGYVPIHNERMQTRVPGLYVAGNITGVESALVAMAQGRLAGTVISSEAGKVESSEPTIEAALRAVRTTRQSALIQFHPDIAAARNRLYESWKTDVSADSFGT